MKKLIAALCVLALFASSALAAPNTAATAAGAPDVAAPSAILMERTSGTVLYEKNAHDALNPASVTKIMLLLLTMEALEDGRLALDTVITASERAAGMGGSQIYLEAGERMSLHDMLKSIAVSSANDASVAVAEHLAGSEAGFVDLMNRRAEALGMKDTKFENCTGLDAPHHKSSAYDIALMSRELLKHELIRKYTTIWMDSVRDGAFGLTNTNKLIRFYEGATGLKTGFTSASGYCISATAQRSGMELIAVIMKGETSPKRNADASALLNYGFANYALVQPEEAAGLPDVPVRLGVEDSVGAQIAEGSALVLERSKMNRVKKVVTLSDEVRAPVEQGQIIGSYVVMLEDKEIARLPIVAVQAVERLGLGQIYGGLLSQLLLHPQG